LIADALLVTAAGGSKVEMSRPRITKAWDSGGSRLLR
jgi:hypothetical protein